MSISGVSSTTHHSGQISQDFQAIGSALQSGNLSTAQTALSTFQQALQAAAAQNSVSQPFGKNTQANSDYQSLSSALQSGDLTSAQKAFASLQTDLKPTQTSSLAIHGHHHSHGSGLTTVGAASSSVTANAVGSLNATA